MNRPPQSTPEPHKHIFDLLNSEYGEHFICKICGYTKTEEDEQPHEGTGESQDWRERFDEKFYRVRFQDRRHTCEGWNGLGDDAYGQCVLETEQMDELKSFIAKEIEAAEERKQQQLSPYCEHDSTCPRQPDYAKSNEDKCTCGLDYYLTNHKDTPV